jgi:hypothetical protein
MQQMHETREEKRDDYASGIIFSSLHDVGQHLTDLVVKRLIMTARRPKAWRPSLRADSGVGVLEKQLRRWAPYKRHAPLPLSSGLRFLQRNDPPAGLLLYAITVYDETHLRALTRGTFGPDGGGPSDDNDSDDEGPRSTRKRRVRAALRAVSGTSDTTTSKEELQKRKATADTGEGSRGAKAAKLETAKKETHSPLGIAVMGLRLVQRPQHLTRASGTTQSNRRWRDLRRVSSGCKGSLASCSADCPPGNRRMDSRLMTSLGYNFCWPTGRTLRRTVAS